MSLTTDIFIHTKDNGRFNKHNKCKFCKKQYINKLNFHNHQNNCNNYYTEDNFLTEEIIYTQKKSSRTSSSKKSPRIICDDDDEDNAVINNEIIDDKIRDDEIIEDTIIDDKIIEDTIVDDKIIEAPIIENVTNINNKLISKRKRTKQISITKHRHSNGLVIDKNFTKIKGDNYFKHNNKNVISFDNNKIIIDTKNTNELTITL